MIVNTFPVSLAAPASANITDVFLKKVTLPLPQAISSGLMAEPDFTLPVADGSGFIASVEGWMPRPVYNGLPAAVTEPAADAIAISTPEELQAMAAGSYVLPADIDLTEYLCTQTWKPISANGSVTLDGQGHTIRGFRFPGLSVPTSVFFLMSEARFL